MRERERRGEAKYNNFSLYFITERSEIGGEGYLSNR